MKAYDKDNKKEYNKEYYRSNRERELARQLAWKKANQEKLSAYGKAYRKANSEKREAYRRKIKYGISQEEFDRMYGEQNGLCKICQRVNDGRALDVDHDHATGKVRGLLCSQCNTALGFMQDSPELLIVASNYLLQNREPIVPNSRPFPAD